MNRYLEQDSQTVLLSITGDIAVVERVGNTVNYYTSSSNPQGIYSITYASEVLARAAVDEFLAAANPPIGIQTGDRVIVHVAPDVQRLWGKTIDAVIVHPITDKRPYWIFSRDTDGRVFIWDASARMELLEPLDP